MRFATQVQAKSQERRPLPIDKTGATCQLDGRPGAAVEEADGEHRAVSGVNTGERHPVIPRDLPRNARGRTQHLSAQLC